MTYDEIHPAFRECLAYYEAFRRLGFPPEDIFFFLRQGMAYAMLRTQGKEFVCEVGKMDCSPKEFLRKWGHVGAALNSGNIPDKILSRIYEESFVRANAIAFMTGLTGKGIMARPFWPIPIFPQKSKKKIVSAAWAASELN